jgi:glycosyltransferase involved in cell wall biosynthesis
MRIIRLIYDWPPPWMGLAPGPFEMTRAQAAQGHAITVLCGARPGLPRETIPGVKVVALTRALKGILAFTTAPAALVRCLFEELRYGAEVVHGHAHVAQWYNLWRLLFGGRSAYFYHLHITFKGREETMRRNGSRFRWNERVNNRMGAWCDAWGCRAADHVFAVNDSVREEALRLIGIPPERITVIKNGVNEGLFRPGPRDPALASRLGLKAEDKILLYVGVFNTRKNLAILFDVLARLPEAFKLVLAGDGAAEYKRKLTEKVAELGLSGRVHFGGYVANPDLPAWYSLADVYVLPSLYEGMPKALLEALACGKPSIVHSGYGLDADLSAFVDSVDCLDAEALAGAVLSVIGRGFKGDHAAYIGQFAWTSIMRKVEAAYRAALVRRSGGRLQTASKT